MKRELRLCPSGSCRVVGKEGNIVVVGTAVVTAVATVAVCGCGINGGVTHIFNVPWHCRGLPWLCHGLLWHSHGTRYILRSIYRLYIFRMQLEGDLVSVGPAHTGTDQRGSDQSLRQ